MGFLACSTYFTLSLASQTLYLIVKVEKGLVIMRMFISLPVGNNTLACIAYGSVICLHPLVIIGAPTHGYLCNCTSSQSEKDLIKIELLVFATTQKLVI